MAEVISRGYLYLPRSSDSSRYHSSSRFDTFCLTTWAPLLRHSCQARTHGSVTCQSPPRSRFRGSKSESLGQPSIINRLHSCETWISRLRLASSCHERRGDGLQRSSLIRARAEAVTESMRGSVSSEDAWNNGISFDSRPDRVIKGNHKQYAQSIGVAVTDTPPSEVALIQRDTGLLCVVLLGAFLWVRLFDYFTTKNILEQKLSRKIVHITSGLLYMLSWPTFSSSKWAPFIAGMVPLANGIRLMIYGFGILKDEGLVNSMSRSGESRELLRGPLYYVLVLYASTVLFWRQSPVGMIALSMMCGGDGIADIMGRKFGSTKLPYNSDKSFAGSISMFLFGFLVSSIFISYFAAFGFFELDLYSSAVRLALISVVATIVESLPITSRLDDNFTVPATAFLMGIFLFPSQ